MYNYSDCDCGGLSSYPTAGVAMPIGFQPHPYSTGVTQQLKKQLGVDQIQQGKRTARKLAHAAAWSAMASLLTAGLTFYLVSGYGAGWAILASLLTSGVAGSALLMLLAPARVFQKRD